MNNSKMWLVVKPTVGVPLFLSAVAVGSFAVHVAVLSNTTWVSDFLSGQELGSGATAALDAATDKAIQKASYLSGSTDGDTRVIMVEMPDGSTALATLKPEQEAHATHLLPEK
ncbi:MAG: light-harvesting protein [Pseudomonadota bacterium]